LTPEKETRLPPFPSCFIFLHPDLLSMRINPVILVFIIVLAAILVAGCTISNPPPQGQPVKTPIPGPMPASGSPVPPEQLVAFVEKAYEYAHVHGKEAALREFNNRTGQFVDGELYIFAYDPEGNTLALPFQPDLIGKNRWNTTDANGTPIIQDLIAAARSGRGFTRYFYPDPSDNFRIKPKLSYVMMVDQEWLIGSGIYNPDMDDPIVRIGGDPGVREDLRSLVDEAIDYAVKHGKDAALREFNDRNGTFVRGNRYIYAFDYNGTTLALPFQPRLIGTDLSGLQDPFGVNYTRVEILLAQHGGGFIFYHYPNPARTMTLEPKMSYVQRVDDTWWIGTGIYLKDWEEVVTADDLAGFVKDAAAYAAAAGEQAALAEFSKKDGMFSHGNLYIYAYDYNLALLAHPFQEDLVGTNRTNWTDIRGLPVIRIGAYTASAGGGFIAYLYPAPEGGTIDEKARDTYQPKIGYVFPAGKGLWIGSGMYFTDMVPEGFSRPGVVTEMIGLVERCAAYGRERGSATAFAEISNRTGMCVDADGHYVYAYDYNGTLLAHPYLPEKIGSNLMNKRDRFGMEMIRALAETARSGGGYVVFIWPNPGKGNREELKIGYVLPVDYTWWVGSGVYLSEITGTDASLPSPA
jgi:signal transduction histidine kinase